MNSMIIGTNIVFYRNKKNVSQKELAQSINMSPQNLLRIEKGIVNPTANTLVKIMSALKITPNQIFGEGQYENVHAQITVGDTIIHWV